jgi:DnaD/phage-associated family protein
MSFEINPYAYKSIFPVPTSVVDDNIRLASVLQLKVLLYMLRHSDEKLSSEDIAAALSLDEEDTKDAMIFWQERGLLIKGEESARPIVHLQATTDVAITKADEFTARETEGQTKKVADIPISRPSHEQIAARLKECKEFSGLFAEAQAALGKTIGYDGQSVLIMMHDSYGLPFEVILMAVEYSLTQQKTGFSSIAKIGKIWSEQGIDTLEGAMEYIEEHNSVNEVWNKLRSLTDITNRTPTTKQRGYLVAWVKEYGYDENIIYYAYEESVDRTGKMSMPYMDKIIRSWYEKGVKTPMDIQRERAKWQEEKEKKFPQKKTVNNNVPAMLRDDPSYDIDAFTKKAIGLKYKKPKTE